MAMFSVLRVGVVPIQAAGPVREDVQRARMVKRIRKEVRSLTPIADDAQLSRVLYAIMKVPREEFVPAELAQEAYRDDALSIGYDQTISSPYIVSKRTTRPSRTDAQLAIVAWNLPRSTRLSTTSMATTGSKIRPTIAARRKRRRREVGPSRRSGTYSTISEGTALSVMRTQRTKKGPGG